ncbi:hypothetical protein GLOIN_2v1781786 [Rhizophagus irregularis DAOM 181602=DAOM 197198]|uniref:Uncharacterized protein n=1 Tax=Rhizophagus irregularis (strain DAOM 181602 / DAOM 197198 / MUCL 43194) TaxID=747089 RepID=A0A2P4PJ38_RHIID|nr:hypothetical protein GLOIN_2v1781786 [Rhizophagus irregularis DAOM 181602=DAOM 197198]POG65402.1 hypothetical protein GLOIN_2v1781786 [Rhizophagus irregularis DAOM 181602=DAOM 197198]|eukprot:XP_025172268.1 hypothetical protein GLOIN_2v1781786 [Rhizophagus irregularis DAOM 181602=DAOM 197198]
MEKSSPYIQRVRDLYQVAFNTLRRRQKYRRFYDKTWSVYIAGFIQYTQIDIQHIIDDLNIKYCFIQTIIDLQITRMYILIMMRLQGETIAYENQELTYMCKNPNKLSNYAEAVKGGQQHLRKGFNKDFRPWIKCHVIKESEVVLKKDQDILKEDKY